MLKELIDAFVFWLPFMLVPIILFVLVYISDESVRGKKKDKQI